MELRLKIVIIKMLLFNFHLIEKNLMTLNRPHVGLSFGSSVGLFILLSLQNLGCFAMYGKLVQLDKFKLMWDNKGI